MLIAELVHGASRLESNIEARTIAGITCEWINRNWITCNCA